MKTISIVFGWIAVALLLLQLIQVEVPEPPKSTAADEIQAPEEIMALLKRSCYDCHSNSTNWPWYSNIAPISLEVRGHVRSGRNWLNYAIWNQYDEKRQQKLLKSTVKSITLTMPIPAYLIAHEEAKLTRTEREMIKSWAQGLIKE